MSRADQVRVTLSPSITPTLPAGSAAAAGAAFTAPAGAASTPGLGPVCIDAFVSRTMATRLRGLLGAGPLRLAAGLLLPNEWAVHGLGMRWPIDVVFLGRDMRVLAGRRLLPGRVTWQLGAASTLELRDGEIARLELWPGRVVEVREVKSLAPLVETPTAVDIPAAVEIPAAVQPGPAHNRSLRCSWLTALAFAAALFGAGGLHEPAKASESGSAPMAGRRPMPQTDLSAPQLSDRRVIPGHHLAALLRDAEARYQSERPETALADFRFIAEAAPDLAPMAALRVGNILQRQGNLTAALEAYRQASDAALRLVNATGASATPLPSVPAGATPAAHEAGRKAAANAAILALEIAADALARLPALLPDDPAAGALVEMTGRVSRALPSLVGERRGPPSRAPRPIADPPPRTVSATRPPPRSSAEAGDGALPRIDYLPATPAGAQAVPPSATGARAAR